jgi:ribosome-binding protein aMBF1 (putative translation factor)
MGARPQVGVPAISETPCPRCNGSGKLFGDEALQAVIGERVADARKSRDLTQHDLAGRLQIGRTQLANIEMGRGANSITTLSAIARALGVDLKELLP